MKTAVLAPTAGSALGFYLPLGIPGGHAPTGADAAINALEDTEFAFHVGDFGFVDSDIPPNNLRAVKVFSLPSAGVLFNNGTAVAPGQFIASADISAGKFTFRPPANAAGAALTSLR